jgi:hypothetical protein
MTGDPDTPWKQLDRWIDTDVWDIDFMDSAVSFHAQGIDWREFDRPGAAISYFTGHGIIDDGCSTQQACATTAACTTPSVAAGERMPGTCRFSPIDKPRCCYMVDRAARTFGSADKILGIVNYTRGPVRWGESPSSGPWARAGTDGGTNLVVLDISHGILPPFWNETLRNAFSGVHMIATLMTAGGDTANVTSRGAVFAKLWAGNQYGSVAQAWLDTMLWVPFFDGDPCTNLGGGHGFNGCGCHIVVAMDATEQGVARKISENWIDLRSDDNDGQGNAWSSVRWQCNYQFSSKTQSEWEKP